MTEKELQKQVQELADKHGVIWHHCSNAHLCTGQNGLPDLLLLGRHRLAWAELKTSQGYLKSAQNEYRYRLLAAGQMWFLWTPRDLHFGIVEANLRALNEPDGQELGTDYDALTRNSLLNQPESDPEALSEAVASAWMFGV